MKTRILRAMIFSVFILFASRGIGQFSITPPAEFEDDVTHQTFVGGNVKKVILLIHGWNPDGEKDKYDETDQWFYLKNILHAKLEGSGWKLLLYHWEPDANTGYIGWGEMPLVQNAANAADRALIHGDYLAYHLNQIAPNLRQVHLVAHSAGSWAAYRAAQYLLQLNPYVTVQVTLLDPFIPWTTPPPLIPITSLTWDMMNSMAFVSQKDRLYRLENYFAVDGAGDPTLGTDNSFNWRGQDINQQVVHANPVFHIWYNAHAGPIEFYADTVATTMLGYPISDGLTTLNPSFTALGWNRSLFEESFLIPRINAHPQSIRASSGSSVTLNVSAVSSQAISYRWFKDGQMVQDATSASYNFTATSATIGDYVVQVRNGNGMIFSDKATVSLATPANPVITSISPATLPTSYAMQLIDVYGSNFRPSGDANSSTLIFRDPDNIAYFRAPVYVNGSHLQYYITVQSGIGTWSVTVTNAGQTASNIKTFLVQTPPPNTGSLQVNLSPSGAQWRVDGGNYLNSGDIAMSLVPGWHNISYKSVSGFNTPSDQTAFISIGALTTVSVTYAANGNCNYSLSASGDTWGAAGGSDAFTVYTQSGCSWTVSKSASWIAITSTSSGAGTKTIKYSVASNPTTSSRNGTIKVGGRTFTITQHGNQNACTFALTSPGATVPATGGVGGFSIDTGAICDWEISKNANWITIADPLERTGSGAVEFTVLPYLGSIPRSGSIFAGGQTYVITQSGTPPPPGTLATGISNPEDIAADATYIYWADYGGKMIKRVAKEGGQEVVLATTAKNPNCLAVDDAWVYFNNGSKQLLRIPKAGGATVTLATNVTPEKIALTDTRVFWTEATGAIKSVQKVGGSVVTQASGYPNSVAITVSGDVIYWSLFNNPGAILAHPLSGSTTTLWSGSSPSFDATVSLGLAVKNDYVYWTGDSRICRVPINGGDRQTLLTGLDSANYLSCDNSNIYWVETAWGTTNGALKQMPLEGGTVITLATNLSEPELIITDEQNIYWLEWNEEVAGGGSLKWIKKPSAVADMIAPQLFITNPADAARFDDALLMVNGTASDNSDLNVVEARVNGGNWQIATGTTNWSSAVTLVSSNNIIEARSRDSAGNYSPVVAVSVVYTPPESRNPQFITFGPLSKQVVGDAPFTLSASASSGLPVTLSVLSGPASLTGNIVTITGPGVSILRASQAGDAGTAPAANVDQVLIIAPGNNIISDYQRLENGSFTLRFYGETGTNYVINASTNLVDWVPQATNQVSGLGYLEFTDRLSTNHSQRFYMIAP